MGCVSSPFFRIRVHTLSDSTTMMVSPALILSPTLAVHSTIFPSVMVEDSAGMNTSMASAIVTVPACMCVLRRGGVNVYKRDGPRLL